MKVILSRKGFDFSNGDCQNPVLTDGTLLSLLIPFECHDSYDGLVYKGVSCADKVFHAHVDELPKPPKNAAEARHMRAPTEDYKLPF